MAPAVQGMLEDRGHLLRDVRVREVVREMQMRGHFRTASGQNSAVNRALSFSEAKTCATQASLRVDEANVR